MERGQRRHCRNKARKEKLKERQGMRIREGKGKGLNCFWNVAGIINKCKEV